MDIWITDLLSVSFLTEILYQLLGRTQTLWFLDNKIFSMEFQVTVLFYQNSCAFLFIPFLVFHEVKLEAKLCAYIESFSIETDL